MKRCFVYLRSVDVFVCIFIHKKERDTKKRESERASVGSENSRSEYK